MRMRLCDGVWTYLAVSLQLASCVSLVSGEAVDAKLGSLSTSSPWHCAGGFSARERHYQETQVQSQDQEWWIWDLAHALMHS